MNKLEVGMYARTTELYGGLISHITKVCEETKTVMLYGTGVAQYPFKEIQKASYNILDLIEKGDLLEIEYFSLRYEKRVTRLFEVTYKEGRFINLDNAKCQFMLIDNDWTDNDKELEPIIKSIVTKQQFSSIEYRLGE